MKKKRNGTPRDLTSSLLLVGKKAIEYTSFIRNSQLYIQATSRAPLTRSRGPFLCAHANILQIPYIRLIFT